MIDEHDTATVPALHGIMAEFTNADDLIGAVRKARESGYTRMDGYSPYPVGEVADELGFPRSEIGAIMFIGGLCGATFGLLMQTWITVYDYPVSVGGKPFWSWPMYIPITWALLVLTASSPNSPHMLAVRTSKAQVIGMYIGHDQNGLPPTLTG